MSRFNNLRRKSAVMAADPFAGAVAEVLICGIAEPGCKSVGKEHLFSSSVELFAQNCSHFRPLSTSSRPPADLQPSGRRLQVVPSAGLFIADAAHPRSDAFAGQHLRGSLPAPARTDGSKGAFVTEKSPFA